MATTNIDCFLTEKFVATKKFEKRNIMAGFRQLFFPTWVPNTEDIWQLITATPGIISQQF